MFLVCAEECQLLEDKVSASRQITGNLMMPGFTAPKLLWVQRHEAAVFSQVDKVLLPKDYLRLRMTGELASDMSDAAGTMWLDVARRDWSDEMLAACDLSRDAMPALFEGSDVTRSRGSTARSRGSSSWNTGWRKLCVAASSCGQSPRHGFRRSRSVYRSWSHSTAVRCNRRKYVTPSVRQSHPARGNG